MKKKEKSKFTFEKFKVAKIQNPKQIIGGSNQTLDPPGNTIGGTDTKQKTVSAGG